MHTLHTLCIRRCHRRRSELFKYNIQQIAGPVDLLIASHRAAAAPCPVPGRPVRAVGGRHQQLSTSASSDYSRQR